MADDVLKLSITKNESYIRMENIAVKRYMVTHLGEVPMEYASVLHFDCVNIGML